jgi:hypothetical protein
MKPNVYTAEADNNRTPPLVLLWGTKSKKGLSSDDMSQLHYGAVHTLQLNRLLCEYFSQSKFILI